MSQSSSPLVSAEDVANSYRLFLGRGPESLEVIEAKRRQPPAELVAGMLDSDEFREQVLTPILSGAEVETNRFAGAATAKDIEWLLGFGRLGPETKQALRNVRAWPAMLSLVLGDGAFRSWTRPRTSEWRSETFAAALKRWIEDGARAFSGGLDVAEAGRVRGWALDGRDLNRRVLLELYADGLFVGACSTGQFRRDLQDYYGGDGLFGFSAEIDLPARVSSRRSVRLTIKQAQSRTVVCETEVIVNPQVKLDALASIRAELARISETLARIESQLPDVRNLASFSLETYPEYRRAFYQETPAERAALKAAIAEFAWSPRFSIVTPTFDSDVALLEETIRSVIGQDYPNWELILSDDGSPNQVEIAALVERVRRESGDRFAIRLIRSEARTGISEATNRALAAAEGDYIAFLDHDDLLAPEALACMAAALQTEPRPRILYSDEDRISPSADGRDEFHLPHFKPDFDAALLLQVNFACHLLVVETGLCREIGPLNPAYDGAQDHDFLLRAVEAAGPEVVRHIPRVLYHWRMHPESFSADPARTEEIERRIQALIADHLHRTGRTGHPEPHADETGPRRRFAVRLHPPDLSGVSATVVVPTRDQLHLLRPCIDSLLATRSRNRAQFELVVVDNGSADEACLAYLGALEGQDGVRVARDPSRFNWAALNNAAVRGSASDVLIFLNNDTAALSPDWCDELCYWALQPEVGAVGARLLYEDGTIQHAGAVLGGHGLVLHEGVGAPASAGGYLGRHQLAHRTSAVTGACLATRRTVFEQLGGFDASRFAVIYNDTDYCLRLGERGLWVVYTPHATFYHFESKTRGFNSGSSPVEQAREVAAFKRLWGDRLERDPFYNPHFERDATPFTRLAPPPRHD